MATCLRPFRHVRQDQIYHLHHPLFLPWLKRMTSFELPKCPPDTMPLTESRWSSNAGQNITGLLVQIGRGWVCTVLQWEKLFSGCVAGATAILSTYPLETLRTRMAISEGRLGLWGSTAQIWRQQGVSGFYQVQLPLIFCLLLHFWRGSVKGVWLLSCILYICLSRPHSRFSIK